MSQNRSDAVVKASFPALDAFALTGGNDRVTAKRMLDLLVCSLAIVLLAPLLVLVALAIAIDSRGPVLFRQRRTGLNGKTFSITKFRTMHVLEDGADVAQVTEGDSRITRVGRFLRASSIDELPQLFNVLAGDMSLVGPRPHALAHDIYYGAALPNYGRRFAVKPGITGWAQVNGARGATPTLDLMQTRIDMDAWYVDHVCLALDVVILVRTPIEVLRHRNAV